MTKPTLQRLADAIQDAMIERGWSQSKLALKSGVSVKAISKLLSDPSETTGGTAEALADALGLSLSEICEGSELPPYKPETVVETGWVDTARSQEAEAGTADKLDDLFDQIRQIAAAGIKLGVDEGELLKLFRRLPAERRADLLAYARFKAVQNG